MDTVLADLTGLLSVEHSVLHVKLKQAEVDL